MGHWTLKVKRWELSPNVGSPLAGGPQGSRKPARRHLSVIGQLTAEVPALQERFAAELTLYVVHGWMHLVGYDDLQPARKRRMRAAEARAMKVLRAAKAIPAFKIL